MLFVFTIADVVMAVVVTVYRRTAKLSQFSSRQKTFLRQLTFYARKENGLCLGPDIRAS